MATLFGDLPAAKNEPSTSTAFKRPMLAPPPSILRNKRTKSEATAEATAGSLASSQSVPGGYTIFSAFGTITDEYDPAMPNEYDAAKKAQEEAVLEAEQEARRAAERRESERAAENSGSMAAKESTQSGQGGPGGMSVAMKLMKSMGWAEGEGLGRERQGMSTPIVLQKTANRTGVIVNAEPMALPATDAHRQGPASRVLLLRNMVSPGEVDEGLEDEVAEEVSKFGQVNRVLVFEVEAGRLPPQEAVRIFVEMATDRAAADALAALHLRFFGGRTIHAAFFDEGRFERMELAPNADEAPLP